MIFFQSYIRSFSALVIGSLLVLAGCGSSSSGASSTSALHSASNTTASSEHGVMSSSVASSTPLVSSLEPVENFYGLYVALGRPGQGGLLGNLQQEQVFLKFVRDNGFNYLILYDLFNDTLLNDRADQVASLIHRAKEYYGVKQVALALGNKAGADAAIAYNQGRISSEKIDVLNLEFEFWHEPDREQAFSNTLDILRYFRQVGGPQGLASEMYIGWINEAEGQALARELDRVLVHYYRTTDVDLVNYGLERLEYLASGRNPEDAPLVITPIFSNEGSANTADIPFMGTWLETNPHDKAFASWQADYQALSAPWKSKLLIEGATWFLYNHFLDVYNLQSHITLHPVSRNVCAGDTISLAAASSVSNVRYCWMYNGSCLQNGVNISGADTATLTLFNFSTIQTGDYYVRITSDDPGNPQTFASTSATIDANVCQ